MDGAFFCAQQSAWLHINYFVSSMEPCFSLARLIGDVEWLKTLFNEHHFSGNPSLWSNQLIDVHPAGQSTGVKCNRM